MTIFFLLVGLEIEREIYVGEFSDIKKAMLPIMAAIGGMLVPGIIHFALNHGTPYQDGVGIPMATDIAFSLGILSLLGSRVPLMLKVFLTALAIIDDLGAIVIIAIFYTAELSTPSFVAAAIIFSGLVLLKLFRVARTTAYLVLGIALWAAVLKSGVHATIAGVVAALFIPLRGANPTEPSPLRRLEEDLHHTVAYGVLPLFAFANAGVSLVGLSPAALLGPVPLGVALGLVLGKPIGVLMFSWPLIRLGIARMPGGVSWGAFAGVAMLCGIGFTMSLFIGSLAFEESGPGALSYRLGILAGSGISAIAGLLVLALTLPRTDADPHHLAAEAAGHR
jgi:NhaA family Na+:H+ antiporter